MTACASLQAAVRARDSGSTRFCMGAAWRGPSQVSIFPYIALHLFLLNPSFCNLPEVDMQTQCAFQPQGGSRLLCMKTLSALPGAAVLLRAWRVTKSVAADVCWITQVGQGQWNRVLDMVSRIRGLGMEVSCLQQLHTLPVHTACRI